MDAVKSLILKYLRGQITQEEQRALDLWLAVSAENRALFDEINDAERVAAAIGKLDRLDEDRVWNRLQMQAGGQGVRELKTGGVETGSPGGDGGIHGGRGLKTGAIMETGTIKPEDMETKDAVDGGRLVKMGEGQERMTRDEQQRKMGDWRRYGWAAAVILVLLGAGGYWVYSTGVERKVITAREQRYKNDIAPGKNAAMLTLAGGEKIVLDSNARGAISRQGNTTITNVNDQLVYKEEKPGEVLYNTLTTGRGNHYRLVLPDGSKVWLNASSSITYPSAFAGGSRKVDITGEAYFEIAKDEKMPFIVERKGLRIQVLGTHFDVNTYEDEDVMKTTLLEGSVRVMNGDYSSLLRPGQQAVIARGLAGHANGSGANSKAHANVVHGTTTTGDGAIRLVDDVDIEEVMAWKNGVFKFNNATIEAIMRQVARWYDVEVVYDSRTSQHFIADVPSDVPVSELLKMLEMTDQVHFRVEGKKITVTR